ENDLFAFGNNTQSIDQYFLDRANGVPLTLFTPQGNESLSDLYAYLGNAPLPTGYNYGNYDMQSAYLGYETFIFDEQNPGDLQGTTYVSNIAGNDFYQEYNQTSTGLNGKLTINTGTQFRDDLYLGLNINSHFINYERTTLFYEENSHPDSDVNEIYYENTLRTLGTGVSLQLGAIYKLGDMFRIGAAYTSPTWYVISEETLQYLETDSNEFGPATANPNVINIFPDYQLRTPGKLTGSLAMVFGKSGLLSFDYSYKDYSNTEFDSEFGNHVFAGQNTSIENNLKAASTYRVGGEYRIENWSLRGGYRFEESPYENEEIMGNLSGYSLGFGYDFGNLELDFAYDFSEREYRQTLLQTGLEEQAFVDNHNSNYTVTLSFGI
ncbi:MAG TPA: outer membrane protein transport protein, partial [Salinimicrobium sp.]|nr:outer membrane protein transport protein [Salinimicrobium sp.]